LYVFYECFKCKKPYFAGGYQCDPSDGEWDPKDLTCARCQPKPMKECDKHGSDWIGFKCRYCCSHASFYCWGKTRFCDNCHKPGNWKALAVYKTGENKKKVWEYKQCASLEAAVKAIGNNKHMDDKKKLEALEKLRADPKKCPLKVAHPPTGFEFGMGCSMCADKDAEEDNIEAAAKAEEEKKQGIKHPKNISKNVFRYKKDFDANGIVYYLGTNFGKSAFVNPSLAEKIKITTSLLQPKTPTNVSHVVGRSPKGGLCMTTDQPNSWLILDFPQFYVTPSHYTLRHANIDSDALRSWRLSASTDGRTWKVIKEHKNDGGLKNKRNSTHTWSISYGKGPKPKFRCFCIMITGPNASRRSHLALGGFEVYGDLSVRK